jgi:hypothetical protein
MYWRGKEKDYTDTCRLDSKAVAGRIRVGRGGRTAENNQSRGVRKALRSHSRVVDVMEHRCYVIGRSSNLLFASTVTAGRSNLPNEWIYQQR